MPACNVDAYTVNTRINLCLARDINDLKVERTATNTFKKTRMET